LSPGEAVVDQAILFAAGPAARLMPLTENRPKAMLLVAGKPLVQHALEALKAHGIRTVAVVVGRNAEKLQSFLQDGAAFGLQVRYVHQADPTGTMDAVRLALAVLDATKPTLLLPGHAYVTAALLDPLAKAKGTCLLVATAKQGHVQGLPAAKGERLSGVQHGAPTPGSSRVSTNLLLAGPELLSALDAPAWKAHKELDLMLGAWAAAGNAVLLAEAKSPWFTLVEPWDVLALNELVLAQMTATPSAGKPANPNWRGAVHVGKNTHVAPTAVLVGPVTIGDGCTIGDFAVVGPHVSIRNASVVGSHCEVRRSLVNNNVLVDSHTVLRSAIVDDGAELGPGCVGLERIGPTGPQGCIVGRDARVAARTVLAGGVLVPAEGKL
jgi:NDP-sugar pyrophosphorylase family protein